MQGELLPIWSETWRDIWQPLSKHPDAPISLFPDLYGSIVPAPAPPVSPSIPTEFDVNGELTRIEDIEARDAFDAAQTKFTVERARYEELVNGDPKAKAAFRKAILSMISSENQAVAVLVMGFAVIDGYGKETFRNRYFILVQNFIKKFSLRYDIRRPFQLCPTLQGIFTGLIRELKGITLADAHLHTLMFEFEDSLRDIQTDSSAGKIKTCIQKQVNLLEAVSRAYPAITKPTLGAICEELKTAPNVVWPHAKVCDAMKNLYGFASDYPGIRHGGTPGNALRQIEIKDLVAITVLLAGFMPYLSHQMDSQIVYQGS